MTVGFGEGDGEGEPRGSFALHCEVGCPVQSPFEKTFNTVLCNSSRLLEALHATSGCLLGWNGTRVAGLWAEVASVWYVNMEQV